MKSLNILILSASLSSESNSRHLAEYCRQHLSISGPCEVAFIDLAAEESVLNYPRGKDQALTTRLRDAFERADAIIIASGIYMWRPCAALYSALEYGLNPDSERRHQPFLMLAAAGSVRSHLAADNLAMTISHEIGAILIAPPIIGTKSDIEEGGSTLVPALRQRIDRHLEVLVHHAHAGRNLWNQRLSATPAVIQ